MRPARANQAALCGETVSHDGVLQSRNVRTLNQLPRQAIDPSCNVVATWAEHMVLSLRRAAKGK